jgi:hypothetical protein
VQWFFGAVVWRGVLQVEARQWAARAVSLTGFLGSKGRLCCAVQRPCMHVHIYVGVLSACGMGNERTRGRKKIKAPTKTTKLEDMVARALGNSSRATLLEMERSRDTRTASAAQVPQNCATLRS